MAKIQFTEEEKETTEMKKGDYVFCVNRTLEDPGFWGIVTENKIIINLENGAKYNVDERMLEVTKDMTIKRRVEKLIKSRNARLKLYAKDLKK